MRPIGSKIVLPAEEIPHAPAPGRLSATGRDTSIKIPEYQYVGFDFSFWARCGRKRAGGLDWGDPVVAPRRVIALPTDAEQRQRLLEISRSRTEPTSRVERARIILAYLQNPSAYAVARAIEVTQQTVTCCLERAAELGVIAALDDRPRAGRDPVITAEAKTWLVALACRKAKELGYPHELWTTRLLAAHARQHGPSAGHPSLGKLAQGTVCKILAEQEVKPHKVRYYLEQRDPEFEPKMAEILCVYRQVAILRAEGEKSGGQDGGSLALVSYDEKPGIQAIGTTAPDRPPLPGTSPTVMRDHEYKRHGPLPLMAGIDLLTSHVHALVRSLPRRRPGNATAVANSSSFSSSSTPPTPPTPRSRSFLTTIPPMSRARPRAGSPRSPLAVLPSRSRRPMGHGSISSRASSPSWRVRCCATSASVPNTNSRNA